MLLAKNGRRSSSKRTRHINIRYFFVADQISSKEVKVEYCPTRDMAADSFTKPLQGTLFCKFRDFIMNIDPLPTSARLKNRSSVLKIIPAAQQDSKQDSTVLTQDSRSQVPIPGPRQTEQVWAAVDCGPRKGKESPAQDTAWQDPGQTNKWSNWIISRCSSLLK
jgi:hypothetical protein